MESSEGASGDEEAAGDELFEHGVIFLLVMMCVIRVMVAPLDVVVRRICQ